MKVYIIAGRARSGKTTFGEYLKNELKEYGYKPCVMQITNTLYNYAEKYFDYDPNRDPKPREFLQKMGVEIIKEKLGKNTFLLERVREDIEVLSEFFDTFIITDARFPEEIEYFKNRYDTVAIKLIRNNYKDRLSEEERSHITETAMEDYDDFSYILENESESGLKNTAKIIIKNEEEGIENE